MSNQASPYVITMIPILTGVALVISASDDEDEVKSLFDAGKYVHFSFDEMVNVPSFLSQLDPEELAELKGESV